MKTFAFPFKSKWLKEKVALTLAMKRLRRMMKKYLLFIFFILTSNVAWADHVDRPTFVTFSFENDVFFKDDGLYSNGLFLSWGYNQVDALDAQNLPSWIAYLAQKTYLTAKKQSVDTSLANKQYAVTYGFGHILQTPVDISVEELVEEDAPYVGLLAWEVQLLAYDELVIDEIGLILGVVGPISGGESLQTFIHGLNGAREPLGWDNQISNEFVFRLQARRTWRLYDTQFGSGFWAGEFDFLAGVDGSIGNLRSDVGAGYGLRIGQQLNKNVASATVFPVQKFNGLNYNPFGWYLFINTSISYVANDIFINGNTFKDSHSVDLIHAQAAISAGIMANIYNFSILYTLLRISDEYEGQAEASRYGSIAITYHF